MPVITSTHGLNIQKIRSDFPLLSKKINDKPLVYFDSAATTFKPLVVINRLQDFYLKEYGKPEEEHELSKITTAAKEDARAKVAKMMGAAQPKEIVFTKGCTESINIVANGFARAILKPGDEVIISQLEHHANVVPWHMACKLSGAVLKVVPIDTTGELRMDELKKMITDKTRIISICHSSHVLGTILPIEAITALAHEKDIPVLVDGAQAIPHMAVNMQELDCDFYTFSGHKMGSPTGVGVLYGKERWLNKIDALIGGGEMAGEVTFDHFSYADIPTKFEGGTQPFADIIAFGSLIDYLEGIGRRQTADYEQSLLAYATEKLSAIDGVKIYGEAAEKEPVISFDIKGGDVKELEKYLNKEWGIAVRAGQLTAQPLMKVLGVQSLIRASFTFYNTFGEIDVFSNAIEEFCRKSGC